MGEGSALISLVSNLFVLSGYVCWHAKILGVEGGNEGKGARDGWKPSISLEMSNIAHLKADALISRRMGGYQPPLAPFPRSLPRPLAKLVGMPMISLGYPLYASIWAIETKSPVGTQQWLTYWVLYSMIAIFELTFSVIIQWIPFWSFAKLITYCWLVLPYFSGASYVYGRFVRPMLVKGEIVDILRNASWENMNIVDVLKNAWEKINTSNIWRNTWKKTSASNKGEDILTAAYRQMKKENGKS